MRWHEKENEVGEYLSNDICKDTNRGIETKIRKYSEKNGKLIEDSQFMTNGLIVNGGVQTYL